MEKTISKLSNDNLKNEQCSSIPSFCDICVRVYLQYFLISLKAKYAL